MRSGWIFGIGLVVLSVLASAPARAEGPGADMKLLEDMKIFTSPDNKVRIEQYSKDAGDKVITLSFDIQGNDRPTPWIEGWRCVYDTQTGKFAVPAVFAEHNAKARMLPKPKAHRG
jgi:hypothetical protein